MYKINCIHKVSQIPGYCALCTQEPTFTRIYMRVRSLALRNVGDRSDRHTGWGFRHSAAIDGQVIITARLELTRQNSFYSRTDIYTSPAYSLTSRVLRNFRYARREVTKACLDISTALAWIELLGAITLKYLGYIVRIHLGVIS